jgi:hypothetical protein
MRSRPILAGGEVPESARMVRLIFDRLWPVDDGSKFGALLRAIDEAIFRHQCRSRLNRFHRMLERVRPD